MSDMKSNVIMFLSEQGSTVKVHSSPEKLPVILGHGLYCSLETMLDIHRENSGSEEGLCQICDALFAVSLIEARQLLKPESYWLKNWSAIEVVINELLGKIDIEMSKVETDE